MIAHTYTCTGVVPYNIDVFAQRWACWGGTMSVSSEYMSYATSVSNVASTYEKKIVFFFDFLW